jgi:cation transporter-like permease
MAQKRDSYEDDSDDEPDKIKIFDKITLVTGIVFIILGELFLYLLSVKTGSTFAMKEILFGLMSGISLTLFLIWIKYIMAGNKHLGGILGVG